MVRTFLQADDLRYFVAEKFGSERRLTTLQRLTGGTKKGVYRLGLDDGTTVIGYVWAETENYWPPAATVPDDPFTDATGADLFAVNHAALTAAGVRVPELILLDRSRQHLDADVALVEDAGETKLEDLLDSDHPPLAELGDALRRMHTTESPHYGKLAAKATEPAIQTRRTEDIIRDRALADLDAAAERDPRLARARDQIVTHVDRLWAAIKPRQTYALVHGELGPDHVLVTKDNEPVMIDFEGLAYFDIEWDHAWLEMRFGEQHYQRLNPVECDQDRLEFYRYAQVLSLIEGPLRIATTDFPDRQWMLDLAEWNIAKAFAAVGARV
ncbi:aminoglycoside phosphotransferase [Asanoa ferruginea]|uniref:phosphotransferase family protein n=1 Tax=Asanoa ferruginea TaxID=53367 RepID=UPI000E25F09C|nr:aminoglycoside phosphotransferase family protein [Asanoa ferruginea]GIF53003.1 aminoglycoside phosphotransferase [Asanoa ferruginea]